MLVDGSRRAARMTSVNEHVRWSTRSVSVTGPGRAHEEQHGGRPLRDVRGPGAPEHVEQAAAGGHRAGAHEDLSAGHLAPGPWPQLGLGLKSSCR